MRPAPPFAGAPAAAAPGSVSIGPMKYRTLLRNNRGFLLFLVSFALLRTAVADWNPIPSGSMRPTLKEGDVVLVNRLAYDLKLPLTDVVLLPLGEPQRGDVVTFSSPATGTRLIKRIVGLPGDRIALHDDQLWINGQPLAYGPAQHAGEWLAPGWATDALRRTEHLPGRPHAVQQLPAVTARRDMAEITLLPDQFFMMGDNRDNSEDSRYFGPVPRQAFIGRAHHVLVSADWLGEDGWRMAPRWGRWGSEIQ